MRLDRKLFLSVPLLGLALLAASPRADADVILAFGQSGISNTVSATNNGLGSTTLSAVNVPIFVTSYASASPATPFSAFLNLSAMSVGAATTTTNGDITQVFSGSFTITSGAGGSGTNYLSGAFTDTVTGAGSALTLSASQPPHLVSLTSDLVGPLGYPEGISFGFSNVTPQVSIVNGSLSSFTASVSGNMSANVVPEPSTVVAALTGLPVLGLVALRRRRRKQS